jgi:DNA-directed RNA polymerase subunit RPC12/RpoP
MKESHKKIMCEQCGSEIEFFGIIPKKYKCGICKFENKVKKEDKKFENNDCNFSESA